jgi:hypothetical protein
MTSMRSRVSALVAATMVVLACVACSKDEPPAPAAPSATPSASAPPLPALPEAAVPSAATSATVPPSASVTPAPSSSAKGAATCGDKPLPPCPLAAWMKANTSPAMTAQDFVALDKALQKIVTFAPPGYTNWVSISNDGADAARAASLDGVKAACRGCHNQYKDRYRKEMRDRPITP